MRKILFPTDFSAASLNAFAYALHLADTINAEIITVHVYEFPVGSVADYQHFLLENYEIIEWSEFENYKSTVPKLRTIAEKCQLTHIKLSHLLEMGNTVDVLLKVAESEHVDYIVMGTNGASGLNSVLFGTVTEKIMNSAKVMVFAVPAQCEYTPISNILFLTQFEDQHKTAFHKLMHFADMFRAHIDVLQVKEKQNDLENPKVKEWEKNYFDEDIDFKIVVGDVKEDVVLDFITLNHNNVLAMTVKHKGLFEKLFANSMARAMAFHSTIPVLAMPIE